MAIVQKTRWRMGGAKSLALPSVIIFFCIGMALASCTTQRPVAKPDVKPVECLGSEAKVYEPVEEKAQVASKVQDAARDAYDRLYYLRQAKADNSLVTTRDSVPLNGAETATVLVNMKRGSLVLSGGGTSNLVEGEFEYSINEPIPIVSYQTKGGNRTVNMLGMGKDNLWKVQLSERIPVAIRMSAGGGVREFNFEDIPLTEFSLQGQGGPSVVNLAGDQPYLTSLDIHQRQGSIGFTASGSYEALEKATIMTCDGDVSANFTGFYNKLDHIEIGSRKGDVDLDLTGCWQKITSIRVVATCGNLKIKIPAGLGTSVKIFHSCASICAVGMHRTWSYDSWVNPAYGKTKEFLDIRVDATCGNIDLILDTCCCPPWVW